jgi:hypothetical protein
MISGATCWIETLTGGQVKNPEHFCWLTEIAYECNLWAFTVVIAWDGDEKDS